MPRKAEAQPAPPVLLPYQQRLLQTVADHPVTLCEKSRRIGMTWAAGALGVLTSAAARAAGGMDTLYVGTSHDMAREYIDACADWARATATAAEAVEATFWHDGQADQSIQAFRIRFASGFEIIALSSRPRSFRGRQGLAIIDEAAFHDDLPGLMKAALAMLIWGGKLLVISTHDGVANPFNALIEDARAGRSPHAVLRVTFDEALADGLYRRICLTRGRRWSEAAEHAWRAEIFAQYGDGAAEELLCIPSAGSGVWLPRALIEARTDASVAVVRLSLEEAFSLRPEPDRAAWITRWIEQTLPPALGEVDPTAPHVIGMDVARQRDLSVIWALSTGRDLARRTVIVIELRRTPFAQQQQVLLTLARRLPRLAGVAVDATGQGAELAERAADALGPSRVDQVMLSTEWYRAEMPPLKQAFEDGGLSIPRDREVVADLASIRLVDGVARVPRERARAADGGTRHGDAAIALALAFAASRGDRLEHQGYAARLEDLERPGMAGEFPRRGPDPERRAGLW